MFGTEFSRTPEILLSSFGQMHASYKKKIMKTRGLLSFLQKLYIRIFGIPEIGFQLRSMYFEEIISKALGNKKINLILDAGSGIGIYAIWLAKKYPRARVIGGEIDKEKILFSSEYSTKLNIKNLEFKYLNVVSPVKKGGKYDLIVNIDVLEHIDNYEQVLRNFSKQIASKGYLFIHTPQPNQKRIFKSLEHWAHEDHVHEGYTPEDLSEQLKKLGFKIRTIRETFGFFGKLSWELNHLSLKYGFVFAGLVYPMLYLIARVDLLSSNKEGLGTAILAQKK